MNSEVLLNCDTMTFEIMDTSIVYHYVVQLWHPSYNPYFFIFACYYIKILTILWSFKFRISAVSQSNVNKTIDGRNNIPFEQLRNTFNFEWMEKTSSGKRIPQVNLALDVLYKWELALQIKSALLWKQKIWKTGQWGNSRSWSFWENVM